MFIPPCPQVPHQLILPALFPQHQHRLQAHLPAVLLLTSYMRLVHQPQHQTYLHTTQAPAHMLFHQLLAQHQAQLSQHPKVQQHGLKCQAVPHQALHQASHYPHTPDLI